MMALTSIEPKCMPMHLCTPPPNGVQAYLCAASSWRSGLKRSGSNVSGCCYHGSMRCVT
jgi:hypothetical protein